MSHPLSRMSMHGELREGGKEGDNLLAITLRCSFSWAPTWRFGRDFMMSSDLIRFIGCGVSLRHVLGAPRYSHPVLALDHALLTLPLFGL